MGDWPTLPSNHGGVSDHIPSLTCLDLQRPFLFCITVVAAVHELVGHLVMHR